MLAAAAEDALGDHFHGEVGTVCGLVLQGLDAKAIEILTAVAEALVVGLPLGNGIQVCAVLVNDAGGEQDGVPKLLHSGGGTNTGEHLLGPGLAGHGSDAPLVLVVHGVTERLDHGETSLGGLGKLLLVDALQTIGIVGHEVEHGGILVQAVLELGALDLVHDREGLEGAVAVMQLGQGLIAPLHRDAGCALLVAGVHAHGHELGLIQGCLNDDGVSLLDGNAALGQKGCVIL